MPSIPTTARGLVTPIATTPSDPKTRTSHHTQPARRRRRRQPEPWRGTRSRRCLAIRTPRAPRSRRLCGDGLRDGVIDGDARERWPQFREHGLAFRGVPRGRNPAHPTLDPRLQRRELAQQARPSSPRTCRVPREARRAASMRPAVSASGFSMNWVTSATSGREWHHRCRCNRRRSTARLAATPMVTTYPSSAEPTAVRTACSEGGGVL